MLLLLQGIAQEGKEESGILTPEPAVPTALFSKLWFSQVKDQTCWISWHISWSRREAYSRDLLSTALPGWQTAPRTVTG